MLSPFENRRLRSNPQLAAVAIPDLPPTERDAVMGAAGEGVWAVLRNRETGSITTGIDHETAVIFHALSTPQLFTALPLQLPPQRRAHALARLVSDQVLQVEADDGSFVDGIGAAAILFEAGALEASTTDPLSAAAIRHAVIHPSRSVGVLATRLYGSNTAPRTRQWGTRLGTPEGCGRFLGVAPRATWGDRVLAHYHERGVPGSDTPWIQWTHRDADRQGGTRHKLYVSPIPSQLAVALSIVADICLTLGVPAFKVGATLHGALRPDKLVVYVRDEHELWRVAEELSATLRGLTPQGVPFATPIDPSGLLSWAIDPSQGALLRPIDEPWSWRTAIAGRLAETIARAKGRGCDERIEGFAMERLRLDGIDPTTWRSHD